MKTTRIAILRTLTSLGILEAYVDKWSYKVGFFGGGVVEKEVNYLSQYSLKLENSFLENVFLNV